MDDFGPRRELNRTLAEAHLPPLRAFQVGRQRVLARNVATGVLRATSGKRLLGNTVAKHEQALCFEMAADFLLALLCGLETPMKLVVRQAQDAVTLRYERAEAQDVLLNAPVKLSSNADVEAAYLKKLNDVHPPRLVVHLLKLRIHALKRSGARR